MRRTSILTGLIMLALAGTARATTVADPVGDFIGSYTGPHDADLDVTSFSVGYDSTLQQFLVRSTMAGAIDPTRSGFYVIGVNTGLAASPGPFAAIGQPDVLFNRVVVVQKSGAATIGGAGFGQSAQISGDTFRLIVPLSALGAATLAPDRFGWNIWPRSATTPGVAVISDFAPENATIAAVPEPASWAMMVGGFGLIGAALRRRVRIAFA